MFGNPNPYTVKTYELDIATNTIRFGIVTCHISSNYSHHETIARRK